MRLVMTVLVRDEEDVLEEMLRYHLDRGVDHIIATDNRSQDSTPEILERFEREGCLHVIRESDDDYRQGEWVTRMARLAATRFGADWVINADADEFWWPRTGSLKTVLAELPSDEQSVAAPVAHFVPRRDEDGRFVERLVVRAAREQAEGFGAGVLPSEPKIAHRGLADVEVRAGNHRLGDSVPPPLPWWPIVVLHFPIRSFAQFEHKVAVLGAALERNPEMARLCATKVELERLRRRGALRAWYDGAIPTEEQISQGIAGGDMVVDRRLQRSIADRGRAAGEGDAGTADDVDALELAQVRLELQQALRAQAEQLRLHRRLARAERRAEKLERRLEKARSKRRRSASPTPEHGDGVGSD